MPPRRAAKRSLRDADANASSSAAGKKAKTAASDDQENVNDSDSSDEVEVTGESTAASKGSSKPSSKSSAASKSQAPPDEADLEPLAQNDPKQPGPYEYVCVSPPSVDVQAAHEESSNGDLWKKPASEHPEWKWIMMWNAYKRFENAVRENEYRDPDNCDMCIYNDWAAYGQQEVIENIINAYMHTPSSSPNSLQDRWTLATALAWFMSRDIFQWHGQDDGERTYATVDLIGNMFLNCLELLSKAGKLDAKGDDGGAEFRDVPLVMALYLKLAEILDEDMETEELIWHHHIIAYATRHCIPLSSVPLKNIKQLISNSTDEYHGTTWPEELRNRADEELWDFKKSFNEFARKHGRAGAGKIGGQEYDITKMSSEERAEAAFDKVDPIPLEVRKQMEKGEGVLDFA